jgi:mannose-6-phosphate isomerase class I
MAVALSEFEALCGFCPHERLQEALREVPELAECVGAEAAAGILSANESSPEVHDRSGYKCLLGSWRIDVVLSCFLYILTLSSCS